jgi:hypothetical protein
MPGNKKVGNETALEIPTQENPILEKTSSDETWKEGRRIVEFEVLSKGLMCENCKTPIHLSDIISETLSGLASILTVKCFKCGTLTKVPTGKRHRLPNERGPGPPVNHITFKKCEREIGTSFEAVSLNSCDQAIEEELTALNENEG